MGHKITYVVPGKEFMLKKYPSVLLSRLSFILLLVGKGRSSSHFSEKDTHKRMTTQGLGAYLSCCSLAGLASPHDTDR